MGVFFFIATILDRFFGTGSVFSKISSVVHVCVIKIFGVRDQVIKVSTLKRYALGASFESYSRSLRPVKAIEKFK